MPWGDRTGPLGQGPRTGRGLGYCAGYDSPGYTRGTPAGRGYGLGRGWFGRGRGFGFGRGFGWRWNWPWPSSTATPSESTTENAGTAELSAMKDELNSLKSAVEGLLNRIAALTEKGSSSDETK